MIRTYLFDLNTVALDYFIRPILHEAQGVSGIFYSVNSRWLCHAYCDWVRRDEAKGNTAGQYKRSEAHTAAGGNDAVSATRTEFRWWKSSQSVYHLSFKAQRYVHVRPHNGAFLAGQNPGVRLVYPELCQFPSGPALLRMESDTRYMYERVRENLTDIQERLKLLDALNDDRTLTPGKREKYRLAQQKAAVVVKLIDDTDEEQRSSHAVGHHLDVYRGPFGPITDALTKPHATLAEALTGLMGGDTYWK